MLEIDQPIESHLERRVELRGRQRLARAEEVHVDEQQAGFDARDIEREQARRPQAEGGPDARERVPHRAGVVTVHPDLIAEVAGVAGARDLDGAAGDPARRHAKVLEMVDVGFGRGAEERAADVGP